MNNLNIPLYRAEKIESDKYVEGFLIKKNYDNQKVRYFILEDKNTEVAMTYEIDPTTLSIHFNNMTDSQGNKIFASLREDGKGGDVVKHEQVLGGILKSSGPEECIIKYCNRDHIIAPFFINAKYKNQKTYMTKEHLLIIGIQK